VAGMSKTDRLRALNAKCDVCPLGPKGCLSGGWYNPVMTERHKDDQAIAVASHPTVEEVSRGHPFASQDSGGEWNEGLVAAGKHRTNTAITYAVCCVPPGEQSGAFERMLKTLDKINKQLEIDGKPTWPSPADCCRPRLFAELSEYENIITLGKRAFNAVTGESRSILRARGDFIEFTADWRRLRRDPESQSLFVGMEPMTEADVARKVFPTLEPSYIGKSPGWRHDWREDLGKAFRWFENRLRWVEPLLLLYPTPAQLLHWFESFKSPFHVVDVETDGISALETYLRCVGFATPDLGPDGLSVMPGAPHDFVARSVGIDIFSGDGVTRHMQPDVEAEIFDILRYVLSSPKYLKVAHNGYFDYMVLGRLGSADGPRTFYPRRGIVPWLPAYDRELVIEPRLDTLFPTRARAPEQPKGLKTIGTILTDIGHWETTDSGDKGATTRDDVARLLYNTRGDTVVNARIVKPLVTVAAEYGYFREIEPGPRERRL